MIGYFTVFCICMILLFYNNVCAAPAEKTYTKDDINALTQTVDEALNRYNKQHEGFGLNVELSSDYQVYMSKDGQRAIVVYDATYRNKVYTIYGVAPNNYYSGVNTVVKLQEQAIENKDFIFDPSYFPEDEIIDITEPETSYITDEEAEENYRGEAETDPDLEYFE